MDSYLKKILYVGGGSGGHITPLLAIHEELTKLGTFDYYWIAPHGDKQVTALVPADISVRRVSTGKIRRYAHWHWWEYFTHVRFMTQNIIDLFKIGIGIIQSIFILMKIKPDIMINKGGYSGLPVGIAARLLKIPYILHDSDTRPGLANRLLRKKALVLFTGFPADHGTHVGIPVRAVLTKQQPRKSSHKLTRIFITGGSLGARRINQAVLANLNALTAYYDVVHVSGAGEYESVRAQLPADIKNYQLFSFLTDEYIDQLLQADVVIGRAGATTLAEFAALEKKAVIIPNSYLGDQVQNAELIKQHHAAIIADENMLYDDPSLLLAAIEQAVKDDSIAKNLHELLPTTAASKIAKHVIQSL